MTLSWYRMLRLLWVVIVAGLAAGTEPDAPASTLHLALGSRWTVNVNSLCPASDCDVGRVVQLTQASVEPSGSVDVVSMDAASLTLEALERGESLMTLLGLDSDGASVELRSRVWVSAVDRLTIDLQCAVDSPSTDPWIVPPGSAHFFQWSLTDESGQVLFGEPEFEPGEIELSELDLGQLDGIIAVPETPGSHSIESELLDGPVATIEVHSEGDFDGLVGSWSALDALEIGGVARLQTVLTVDERRVCTDSEARLAWVQTPDTCSFSRESWVGEIETEGPDLRVFGIAEGTCTIGLSLPTLGLEDSWSLEVISPTVVPEGS